MKKVLFVIAMVFASFSSSVALAGSQTYTSPWRKPFDEGETGLDRMIININSFCSVFELSGSFNPTGTWPNNDTYIDLQVYNSAGSGFPDYRYYFGPYGSNDTNISFTEYNSTWAQALVYMNISNGSATVTANWYF